MLIFRDIAPYVIAATFIICASIALRTKKNDIRSIDGLLSILGLALGCIITLINLKYSNNYVISLGPLLALTCVLYIRFRSEIVNENSVLSHRAISIKIINLTYWLCIFIALMSYYQAATYYRPLIFFFAISLSSALLALNIIIMQYFTNTKILIIMFKIFLISLILRASAYFITPFPIGSDPWIHAEYIKWFLQFNYVMVPQGFDLYYCNYPLAHLLACAAKLIENVGIKESMFIIGAVTAISTLFVYLVARDLYNNINLALLSMLLLSLADFHVEWSIEVIAMTFGIAIYSIIIYLILRTRTKQDFIFKIFQMVFIIIIIWTHTISSFIALISILSLYIGSFFYTKIYKDFQRFPFVSGRLCMIFVIILILHWMDPNYPFIDSITSGFIDSLTREAKFLGRESIVAQEYWTSLFNIIGFLFYIFLGIIGCLYNLSRDYANRRKFSLIFMVAILFFIFFAFPTFGIRNIVPYRWPAFIYVGFVLFSSSGLMRIANIFANIYNKQLFIFSIMLISSFFMITCHFANPDSVLYGKEIAEKFYYKESEIALFQNVNNIYTGVIVSDVHSNVRYFGDHLNRDKRLSYPLSKNGDINWSIMNDKLVIWEKASIERPMLCSGEGGKGFDILLGNRFKKHLDENFNCIYNTEEARAYLGYKAGNDSANILHVVL